MLAEVRFVIADASFLLSSPAGGTRDAVASASAGPMAAPVAPGVAAPAQCGAAVESQAAQVLPSCNHCPSKLTLSTPPERHLCLLHQPQSASWVGGRLDA